MERNSRPPIGLILSATWGSICLLAAIFGGILPGPKWDDYDYENFSSPMFSTGHFLGTDIDGTDIFAGLIHGARTSLGVSLLSVSLGLAIGGSLGILAAYRRGWVDRVLSMVFNVMLSVPNIVLVLVFVAVFSSPDINDPSSGLPKWIVLVISFTIIVTPFLGRIARAATLTWSGREFVQVAESIGMTRRSILWTHIVPNVVPSLISIYCLGAGVLIVVEGGLSILGLGFDSGGSWGSMLAKNRNELAFSPHTILIPATVIALTVMSLNYFADYMRIRIDGRESRI